MDMYHARHNLVEHQIIPCGVLDVRIVDALLAIPREHFVPTAFQQLAYADAEIPLGYGQVMLQPSFIGRVLQGLQIQGSEQILEIGIGSGYLTALLSKLGQHVTSVELNKQLAVMADSKLKALQINNAEIIIGNAVNQLKSPKSFDVAVITGSLPYLPKNIAMQIKYGGRLFITLGKAPVMEACIFTRINEEGWSQDKLFETEIRPLEEIVDAATFEF